MLLFHSITSKLFNNKKTSTNIKLLAAPKKKDENTPTLPVKRGPGRPPGSNNKNPSSKNNATTGNNNSTNNNTNNSEPPEKRSKVDLQSGKQEAVTPLTSLQVKLKIIG